MALLEGRLPKNAQSWNENLLVDAFTKRADVARGKGQQQWHKWQKDADKIRAVRKHIYQQQSGAGVGAIKNLPKDLSSKGLEVATAIVYGRQPVVPAEARTYGRGGASYVRPQDAPHPYLKRMAFQKGGYAIFMAFKTSGKTRMGKREIINRAQPYSTEDMASDFFAGRPRSTVGA